MSERIGIGVDIGGTKTAIGVVTATGELLERVVVATPKESAQQLIDVITQTTSELAQRFAFTTMGVAIAGLVDANQAKVAYATHLPVRGLAMKAQLEAATGLTVLIENDATAALWAEWAWGAARELQNSVMVAIGTGIGGGFVVDGHVQRGATGLSGEIGHLRFVPDGIACPCGLNGCWEQYGSGRVLDRWAQAEIAAQSSISTKLIEQAGSVERISGRTVSELARAGAPEAVKCLEELGRNIGIGMASLATILDPELFVIGGGLLDNKELLLGPMSEAFEQHLFARDHRAIPRIVPAACGPDAALIGAAGQLLA
ncbi:MAG: ROK family protein [Aeromicrobium sp.]|nr:MAG: ROK family protein [Aeromicrobium sp.]